MSDELTSAELGAEHSQIDERGMHDFKAETKCPNCPDRGWYYVGRDGEQQQCEWCWTNPNSNFSRKQDAERLADFDSWWHNIGSAISPNDGHEDVSEFAERVCKEAWKQRGKLK